MPEIPVPTDHIRPKSLPPVGILSRGGSTNNIIEKRDASLDEVRAHNIKQPARKLKLRGISVDGLERSGEAGLCSPLERKKYEQVLRKLHVELVKLQFWVKDRDLKVVVVFEGRDAAGKGGIIKRIIERVSHRVFRVVALPAPTDREKSQMYIQRYIPHMPAAGEVVIFDRSWYNFALVERVMGALRKR